MHYYAVNCGRVVRCVRAISHSEAGMAALRIRIDDTPNHPSCGLSRFTAVHKYGDYGVNIEVFTTQSLLEQCGLQELPITYID